MFHLKSYFNWKVELEQLTSTTFQLAYSHLIVCNQKLPVCSNPAFKTSARSVKECLIKCLAFKESQLRGANYLKSNGTCSCYLKASSTYNVTTDLISAGCIVRICDSIKLFINICHLFEPFNLYESKMEWKDDKLVPSKIFFVFLDSFVWKIQNKIRHNCDCPGNFDYVIEYHKCYKMQYQRNNWYTGRYLCNNISSSHPILLEDDVENAISLSYVNYTTLGVAFSGLLESQMPGYLANRTDHSTERIIAYRIGWDDYPCLYLLCMLCEFDLTI
ncbi:hypothetical protein HELRODRAFT_176453 [Helobdella robusta]|uniref:Uncharacterized protein n=1 Tax=Helobdella robusta TaxID=6412 RepID=T1FAI7_HELRO|nr:hypothetical protein HELRODRAFT_176453 [Helobdella robusta]ESN99692.1 hypothetical protein HELRODRAFT_176453 [Helobdella robusta]